LSLTHKEEKVFQDIRREYPDPTYVKYIPLVIKELKLTTFNSNDTLLKKSYSSNYYK